MISDKDISKLKEVFATKDQSSRLETKVGGLKTDVGALELSVIMLSTKVDTLTSKAEKADEKMNRLLISTDKIAAGFDHFKIETLAYDQVLSRHTLQIKELAAKARVKFSE